MKKITFFYLFSFVTALNGWAQNELDGLRYARTFNVGTARFNAMGGSFGALGADASVISTNPAGLALFKRSEVSISPSIFINNNETDYLGTTEKDGKANFNFNNLSYTHATDKNRVSGWLSSTWQVSYSRVNNHNSQTSYAGQNNTTSILDSYLYELDNNLIPIEDIPDYASLNTWAAWETFAIDTVMISPSEYQYIVNLESFDAFQRKEIETSGSQGEVTFAYSGNYNNRFFIGGSISLVTLNYSYSSTYTETYPAEDTLNSIVIREEYENSGNGFNAKLGMVYRINDYLRVGAAIHSPTFYSVDDVFSNSMTSNFRGVGALSFSTPVYETNYSIRTPWRFMLSGGAIVGKKGLLNVDYELVDYSTIKFNASDYDLDGLNSSIQSVFKTAHNVRVGGEYRINNIAIRGGYRFEMSPYSSSYSNMGSNRNTVSFGGGFRHRNFFIDAAWMTSFYDESVYLYDPSFSEAASKRTLDHRLTISAGIRWL